MGSKLKSQAFLFGISAVFSSISTYCFWQFFHSRHHQISNELDINSTIVINTTPSLIEVAIQQTLLYTISPILNLALVISIALILDSSILNILRSTVGPTLPLLCGLTTGLYFAFSFPTFIFGILQIFTLGIYIIHSFTPLVLEYFQKEENKYDNILKSDLERALRVLKRTFNFIIQFQQKMGWESLSFRNFLIGFFIWSFHHMTIFQILYLSIAINFMCLLLFIYVIIAIYVSGKPSAIRNDPSENFSIFFEILLGSDNRAIITSAFLISSQFILYRSVILNFILFAIIHSVFWNYWDSRKDDKTRFFHQRILLCADILSLAITDLAFLLIITLILFGIFCLFNSPKTPIESLRNLYLETQKIIFDSRKFLFHIAEVLCESILSIFFHYLQLYIDREKAITLVKTARSITRMNSFPVLFAIGFGVTFFLRFSLQFYFTAMMSILFSFGMIVVVQGPQILKNYLPKIPTNFLSIFRDPILNPFLAGVLVYLYFESFFFGTILKFPAGVMRNLFSATWALLKFDIMMIYGVVYFALLQLMAPPFQIRSLVLRQWAQVQKKNHGRIPAFTIGIKRDSVFEDTIEILRNSPVENLMHKVSAQFLGEDGTDQGGITNEWMQIFARSLIDKKYLVEGDLKTYNLSDECVMNSDYDEEFFRLFGRFFALIIFQGRVCPVKLVPSIFKQILKVPITFEDLQYYDHQQYLSLKNMNNLDNETLKSLDQYFEVEVTIQGVPQSYILKPGGQKELVTKENVHEYLQLRAKFYLEDRILVQLNYFKKGFLELIPLNLLMQFNETELQLLLNGDDDIDVEDWRIHTRYENFTSLDEDISWFWEIIKELSQEDKHKFLMAVCGSPNTPFGGFLHLNPPFTIVRARLSDTMAPHTHTCFHSIDLPRYKTKEQSRRMIQVLIDNCEGFGNT